MATGQRRIEAEVEASRVRFGDTLSRLQARLSPAGIAEDVLARARGNGDGAALYDGALRAVRDHPAAVFLIVASAGMLLRRATGLSPRTWLAERGPDIVRSTSLHPGRDALPGASAGAHRPSPVRSPTTSVPEKPD